MKNPDSLKEMAWSIIHGATNIALLLKNHRLNIKKGKTFQDVLDLKLSTQFGDLDTRVAIIEERLKEIVY